MIFCIDIGNSNIKYAIFDGDQLKGTFRVTSQRNATSDEYGVIVRDLLKTAGIPKSAITGVIMSSVIPSLNYTMEHMCRDYLGVNPLIIGPGVKTGLNVKADNPREVGSDIIVDSVSAIKRFGTGTPIVCIDFGTATTFDIISASGELIGVVISPGIKLSLDSLTNGTANLPRIELERPKSVIGKNTVNCMQAGIVFGFAGLVDNIVTKIKEELGRPDTKVIATGGMGRIIYKETKVIDCFDEMLTLNGLRYIYEMNEKVNK
ncbi:MAG: type III pantothenate kinase [Clostridiales bacterium]|nr:type III pantothenate kinase [Clostridiales bacterium]